MAWYTGDTLIKGLHLARALADADDPKKAGRLQNGEKPSTYGDIGEAAFGTAGRVFVNLQMHVTLVMVATVYNLVAGMNLLTIFSSVSWLTPEIAIVSVAVVAWFHVFL